MRLDRWRYQRFHVSYLLGWFAAGLLSGLVAGRYVSFGLDAGWLFVAAGLLLGALRRQRWFAVALILVAGFIGGGVRATQVDASYKAYNKHLGSTITLDGTLSADPQRAPNGQQKLSLGHIRINDVPYPGEIFATLYGADTLKRGDRISLHGSLREGFASYGAALGAARLVSTHREPNVIRDVRERFAEAVRTVTVEPIASLGLGFVVGQRSTLPDALDEQLKVVGLTHIVVASGYNLTILVRFMMRLLSRHSRYLAFVGSLLLIFTFVAFSGLSPSMNRAVIVTVLALLAWYVGRRFQPVLLLLYVAALTSFVNPMYVWSDLGWYLSFFAFAGILIVAPLVLARAYGKREPNAFVQLVIETLCAEVMALPLIAFAFGTIPILGLLANVLVAPFIPLAMVLVALTGVLGMFTASVAVAVALPAMIVIGYMVAVVERLAQLPFAQYVVDIGLGTIIAWYVALCVLCLLLRAKTNYDFRTRDSRPAV